MIMEEIWRDIEGYEELYQVSNFGRVKRLKSIVNSSCRNGGKRIAPEKMIAQKTGGVFSPLFAIICEKALYSDSCPWSATSPLIKTPMLFGDNFLISSNAAAKWIL